MSTIDDLYPTPCAFCRISTTYPYNESSAPSSAPSSVVPDNPDPQKLDPQCYLILSAPYILAFLDIMPIAPGHILLTTRKHYRKLSDLQGMRRPPPRRRQRGLHNNDSAKISPSPPPPPPPPPPPSSSPSSQSPSSSSPPEKIQRREDNDDEEEQEQGEGQEDEGPGQVQQPEQEEEERAAHEARETSRALGEWLPIISRALMRATGIEDWNVVQNNGARAAQVVPHVHFHLIPRYQEGREETRRNGRTDWGTLKSWKMFGRGSREDLDDDEAKELAGRLREALRVEVDGEQVIEGGAKGKSRL